MTFRTWFARLVALPQLLELRKRVEELERAELERETVTADQLDKLTKLYKRLRIREARADQESEPTAITKDSIRRQLIHRAAGGNDVRDPYQSR